MWKIRFFALALILTSGGLLYYNWYQLNTEGKYSFKIAAFTPVCIVGGLFLLVFPAKVGKPETTAYKVLAMSVFAIGIVAGLVNWYLMDPGFFGSK